MSRDIKEAMLTTLFIMIISSVVGYIAFLSGISSGMIIAIVFITMLVIIIPCVELVCRIYEHFGGK